MSSSSGSPPPFTDLGSSSARGGTGSGAAAGQATTAQSRKRSQKFKRSRSGCLACRKAKHKCDEQKPVCVRCRVADKDCTWPASVLPSEGSERSPSPIQNAIAGPSSSTSHPPFVSRSSSSDDSSAPGRSRSAEQINRNPILELPEEQVGPLKRREKAMESTNANEALTICFPNVEERNLMMHFISSSGPLLQSVPVPHLPLIFIQTSQVIASPRGLSIPTDALLFSILSIAAIHQSSLRNLELRSADAAEAEGHHSTLDRAATLGAQTRTRLLASHLAQTSHALLLSSLALSSNPSDTLLATAITLLTGSVLAATTEWKANLDLARRLVAMKGGPRQMLSEAKDKMERGETDLGGLMRVRTMLEYTVGMEVFDCLGTGRYPQLLDSPFCPWWFEFASSTILDGEAPIVDPALAPSDWETVETTMGLGRGMLELISRINALVAQTQFPGEIQNPIAQLHVSSDEEKYDRARELLLELEIWRGEQTKQQNLDSLNRVEFGNMIYSFSMQIVLLVDVLARPHSDASVQHAALCGLQLLVKSNVANGLVVGLMWPAIICGSVQTDVSARGTTLAILEYMRNGCAWDVDAAIGVVQSLWARTDAGELSPSWRGTMRQNGLLFV